MTFVDEHEAPGRKMKQQNDGLGEMRSELIFERALLDNEGSEASVNPDLAAELRELAVELEAFCNQMRDQERKAQERLRRQFERRSQAFQEERRGWIKALIREVSERRLLDIENQRLGYDRQALVEEFQALRRQQRVQNDQRAQLERQASAFQDEKQAGTRSSCSRTTHVRYWRRT